VESQVRRLRSLGVLVGSYGALLATLLVDKLPSELQLIISREAHDEEWKLDNLMKVLEHEIDTRETVLAFQTGLLRDLLDEIHQQQHPCFLQNLMLQNVGTVSSLILRILVRW